MKTLENKTFDEIKIGDHAEFSKTLTEEDIILTAKASGDVNPIHLDEDYAKTTPFNNRIGHGVWTGSLVSAAIGLKLPGPGTIYLSQNVKFLRPVKIGDQLTATVTASEKLAGKQQVTLETVVVNQRGKEVLTGQSVVIAPSEKLTIKQPELPDISVNK